MKLNLFLLVGLSAGLLNACMAREEYGSAEVFSQPQVKMQCEHETVVEFRDDEGVLELPACEEYDERVLEEYIEVLNTRAAENEPVFVEVPEETVAEPEPEVVAEKEVIAVAETPKPEPEQEPKPVIPAEPQEDFSQPQGEFPWVKNNKYNPTEVVLENLNTRVLVFCQGTAEQAEDCARRLESSCYRRIGNIPYLAAKYDSLRRGVYPGRRWREGELVPRW